MIKSNYIKNKIYQKIKNSPFSSYLKHKHLVLMFLPALAYYLLFHYGPLYGIQIAFKNYRFLDGIWGSPWVGLRYFRDLLSMGSFREVFRNTILISLYNTVFGFPAPIILALLLNEIRHRYFKKTVQTISYLPHFISWVILGGLFVQFLSPSVGPINLILKHLGFEPIYFLADENWFRSVLVSTNIWKGVGWGTIIYLATISGINPELYEAAVVDGANRFRQIIHITLPSMAPVITIMLIFSVGAIIKDNFNQVFNLYNPSVYSVGDVISTYTYRRGLVNMEYSFATAVGLFKNIIAFILVLSTNAITKRINEYGIW